MTWATTASGGNTMTDRLSFDMNGQQQVKSTTASTSITTGSLLTMGGLGAGKSIYTGGNVHATMEDTTQQWTFGIEAQAITADAGVTVTQGSRSGTLMTALTGDGMTSIVLYDTHGVTWTTTTNIVISAGSSITVTAGNINSAAASMFYMLDVLTLGKTTSGTAANGIGAGLSFGVESVSGTLRETGTMEFALASVVADSEAATMTCKLIKAGSASPGWSASKDGIASDSTTLCSSVSNGGAFKLTGGLGIAKQAYVGLLMMVESAADSNSPTTGTIVTTGGLGAAKRIYAGVAISTTGGGDATSATTGSLITVGGLGIAKRIYSGGITVSLANTASTASDEGSVVAVGGMGVALNIYAGAAIVAEGTTASTSAAHGSQLTKGGLGVAGRAYLGGMSVVTGATASTTKINGAIVTAGGISAAKSIYTAGQIVSDNDDAVEDAVTDLLVLSHSSTGTPATSLGLGISVGLESAGGLLDIGKLDFVLTSALDASAAQLNIKTITGGTVGNALEITTTKTHVVASTDAESSTTGSLKGAGGMSVAKRLYSASIMVVESNSAPTSSTAAGAILVVGGVGIAKRAYSGSIIVAHGTTAATSSVTGTMVTTGGLGAALSVYTGGQLVSHVVDAVNTGITDLLVLKHETSGTPANNIGVGIDIGIEDATDTTSIGRIDTILTDKTNDGEDAGLTTRLMTAGSSANVFTTTGLGTTIHVPTQATTSTSGALQTSGGVGVTKSIFVAGQTVASQENSVTGVTDIMVLAHSTTGTATNGIGVGISVFAEDAGADVAEMSRLNVVLTDVTNSGEDASLTLKTVTAGSMATSFVSTGLMGLSTTPSTISTTATSGSLTTGGGAGIALQLYTGGIAEVLSVVDATSGTTGSLVAIGGVGVAKRIYAGSSIVSTLTTAATTAVTGSILTTGGMGVALRSYTSGGLYVLANTAATASDEGSLVAVGGMGIALNIYAGAAIVAEGTTVSSSGVTGSLLTKGGLGVAGRMYVSTAAIVTVATASTNHISGSIVTAGGMSIGKSMQTAGQAVFAIDNAVNAAVTDVMVLGHTTSGTAANGIGAGISIASEDAGGTAEISRFNVVLTDVTNSGEDASLTLKTVTAGSMATSFVSTGLMGLSTTPSTISTTATSGSLTTGGGAGIALQLYTGGIAEVLSVVDATSGTTGSLVAIGGVGVAKRIYAGSSIVSTLTTAATTAVTGSILTTGGMGVALRSYTSGGLYVLANTAATASDEGSLVAVGGMGIALNIYAGAAIVAEGTTVSSSGVTGSLLTKGGLGVAGRMYVSTAAIVTVATASTNHISGSIVTAGGMSIGKSMQTAGQAVFAIDNAVNAAVTDVMVLGHTTSGTAANGIGVGISVAIEALADVSERFYIDTTLSDVTNGGEDTTLTIGGEATGSMATSVTFTDATKMTANPATVASTSTTGSLTMTGGVGIAKQLYVGGIFANAWTNGDGGYSTYSSTKGSLLTKGGAGFAKRVYAGVAIVAEGTTATEDSDEGALLTTGGAGFATQLYTGGIGVVKSTVVSSSSITGSLIVKGGAGVALNIYAGSAIVAEGTTAATQSLGGSLVTKGGLAVPQRLYSGGALVITGTTNAVDTISGTIVTRGGVSAIRFVVG